MLKWRTCLRVGVTIVLTYLAIQYSNAASAIFGIFLGAMWPLMLGAGIAYLLNILMRFYEAHYFRRFRGRWVGITRRGACLLGAIFSVLALIALVIILVVPELLKCMQFLIEEVPPFLRQTYEKLLQHPEIAKFLPENELGIGADWQNSLTRILNWLGGGLGGAMDSVLKTVTGVFSGMVTLVMAFVFALYILLSKERLGTQINRLLRAYIRPAWNRKIRYVLEVLDDCFHRFIVGQCIEAVILGVLCILGMLLFRFPYATMIGTLVGFTALIPIAGAYIGAIVGAIMILTVSPIKTPFFLLFIIVLQQLEGNLIYPRVVGSSIGLPGLWVLAAITVGGSVLGIGGMLLGVPLAAAAYRLLRTDVSRRELLRVDEKKKGRPAKSQ